MPADYDRAENCYICDEQCDRSELAWHADALECAACTARRESAGRVLITVMEQSSACDDFRTDNGQGHPDDCEPYEVDSVETTVAELLDELDNVGCGQWDGGNVAYDHDGSQMSPDGTITTRYAVVTFL